MSLTTGIVIIVFLAIFIFACHYFSPDQRLKREINKFIDENQEGVVEACFVYAKGELTPDQYRVFKVIFENKIALGGISMADALNSSIEEAKEDEDEVDLNN